MYTTYQAFVDRMIHLYEGGYGWNRKDPGGPTKYGITCYDLAEYQGKVMNSMAAWQVPVRDMTLTTAEAIYWQKYALGIRYNELPAGVDITMMDYAVNSGLERPIHVACALLSLKPRAKLDNELLLAIKRAGPEWFINAMDNERLAFMHRIRGGTAWEEFGGGWGRRVTDLRSYALAAAKTPLVSPAPVDKTTPPAVQSMPKANHDDPKLGNKIGKGIGSSLPGALAGHLAGVPMSYLVVLVLGAVLAGVLYYFYKKNAAAVANALVADVNKLVPQAPSGATGPAK